MGCGFSADFGFVLAAVLLRFYLGHCNGGFGAGGLTAFTYLVNWRLPFGHRCVGTQWEPLGGV
jgi:hypothetical protein